MTHGSSSSSASGRPRPGGVASSAYRSRSAAPDERVPVRVQAARRRADQHVTFADAMRPQERGLVGDADAEPRQVELVVRHDAGVLGGLPAQERASRTPASFRHALHDRRHALGHHPPDRQVVQEEQRLGSGADDVVGAHRDQVDADGIQPIGHPRDLELGADAVGGRGEHAPLPDPEQPREPADLIGDLGASRSGGQVGDQRHGLRGGLGVDAGPPVRVAHGTGQAVGSCNCSSSTNFPARSGIGTGYSPSKHARQKSSFGDPAARTNASSER